MPQSVKKTNNNPVDNPEKLIVRFRAHPRKLFWPSLALMVISASFGYTLGRFPEAWQNWAVSAVSLALAVVLWLLPVLFWLCHRYTITTRRVVAHRGLFVRIRSEMLLSQAQGFTVRKTMMQTLFRTGDLLIQLDDNRGSVFVLADVADVDQIVETLHDLNDAIPSNG